MFELDGSRGYTTPMTSSTPTNAWKPWSPSCIRIVGQKRARASSHSGNDGDNECQVTVATPVKNEYERDLREFISFNLEAVPAPKAVRPHASSLYLERIMNRLE